MELDVITREVIRNGLINISREMGSIMARTSYSSILNEGKDYSCAIFDNEGNLAAEAEFVLVHLAAMHFSVKACVDKFRKENFAPGDVVMHNDPYLGGSHLPDVTMIRPIFAEGELIAFVANRAHYPDVGGWAPGGFSGEATEIFHEGFIIPPIKLYRNDVLDEQILELFAANVRAPHRIYGDSSAQIASLRLGEKRLYEMIERYGVEKLTSGIKYVMDYSEKMMRKRISEVPEGKYKFFDYMDDSGINTPPVRIILQLTVEGDELIFDYSDTDPEVECPINAPLAVVCSATFGAAKCILTPDVPLNAGMFRPMKIITPEGTLLNPIYPLPVAAGNTETSQRLFDIVLGAFSQCVPRLVAGCHYGNNSDMGLGGYNHYFNEPYVLYVMPVGGLGACCNRDGNHAIIDWMGNCSNQPVEIFEAMYPYKIGLYHLRKNSGGPGTYRGGHAAMVQYSPVGHKAILSIFAERTKISPFGICGGLSGIPAKYVLRKKSGKERVINTKVSRIPFEEGDTFTIMCPGGGGYGNPFCRDLEGIAEDLKDELITPEFARTYHGVILDEKTGEIDRTKTEEYRKSHSPYHPVKIGEVIREHANGRSILFSKAHAEKIGTQQKSLIELHNECTRAPARGWVKISPKVEGEEIHIPQLFAEVLGVKRGDTLNLVMLSKTESMN